MSAGQLVPVMTTSTVMRPAAQVPPAPQTGTPVFPVQIKSVLAFSTYEDVFNILQEKWASKQRTVG